MLEWTRSGLELFRYEGLGVQNVGPLLDIGHVAIGKFMHLVGLLESPDFRQLHSSELKVVRVEEFESLLVLIRVVPGIADDPFWKIEVFTSHVVDATGPIQDALIVRVKRVRALVPVGVDVVGQLPRGD